MSAPQLVLGLPDAASTEFKRTRACLVCGTTFEVNPCHADEHRFCCDRHRAAHHCRAKGADVSRPEDQAKARRLQRKALLILGRLEQGPATNVELWKVGGFRFGARVFELRQAGHLITTDEDRANGIVTYALERRA